MNPTTATLASLLVSVIVAIATPASAFVGLCCAKCGGNMPMNIPGAGVPETHEFRIKGSFSFMRMGGLRDGTDSLDADALLGMPVMDGTPTGKFMAVPLDMDMYMASLAVGYSFTDELFGGIMFMWMKKDMNMKLSPQMQTLTGVDGFPMESDGLGDTMLVAKYRLYADDPLFPTSQLSLFLGLSLPTGSINEKNSRHPVADRRDEQLPYAMQLGSGTFDPIVGVVYQGSASPWWWGGDLLYTPRFYKNSRDYNLGDEVRLDLYAMYQLRYDLVTQVQLNGKWWGKIEGEMDEFKSGRSGRTVAGDPTSPPATPLWDTDNYGGTQLFATLGLQWQPFPLHILDVQVGFPLFRHLNGPQLEQDLRLMVTWYVEIPTPASIRYLSKKKDKAGSSLGF